MKPIVKNKVLIKGVSLKEMLFVPEGVKYLERHAFPWDDFVFLKNEKYLCCFVRVWFSFPDGRYACFAGGGKRNVYQVFRRDYQPFDPAKRHKKVPREEVYASPEFRECVEIEKQKMAGDLYRCVNQLFQHVDKWFAEFRRFPDFYFEQGEAGDYDAEYYKRAVAVSGFDLEKGCRNFVEKNLNDIISEWVPQWIFDGQTDLIQQLCNAGLIPEESVDSLIKKAIETAQETGDHEIQVLLMNYEYQHFPPKNPADKLRMELLMEEYEVTLTGRQYAMLEKMLFPDNAGRLARNQAINGYELFSEVLEEIYSAVESGWCTLEILPEESPEQLDLLRTLTRAVFPDDEDYFVRQLGKKFRCKKDFEIRINLK